MIYQISVIFLSIGIISMLSIFPLVVIDPTCASVKIGKIAIFLWNTCAVSTFVGAILFLISMI